MALSAYFASLSLLKLIKNVPGGVAQGLIWGLMALGVYISFRLLDAADLCGDRVADRTEILIFHRLNPAPCR